MNASFKDSAPLECRTHAERPSSPVIQIPISDSKPSQIYQCKLVIVMSEEEGLKASSSRLKSFGDEVTI